MQRGAKIALGAAASAALCGLFWYFFLRAPEVPAEEIILSELEIIPAEVNPGQEVAITAIATNPTDEELTRQVNLRGDFTGSQTVTLEPGESRVVSFTIIPTEVGEYMVEVDGLFGTFRVTEAAEGIDVALSWDQEDLTFERGSTHIAHVEATNLGTEDLTCTIEFYMIDPYDPTTKYSRFWTTPTIEVGEPLIFDQPVVMPGIMGVYQVFIDMWAYPGMENLIKSFRFDDITIV